MLGLLRKVDQPHCTQSTTDDRSIPYNYQVPLDIELINVRLKSNTVQRVNAIPDLNNCLDQKYIQKKLNKMREFELDQIETELADKIIEEYEQEK